MQVVYTPSQAKITSTIPQLTKIFWFVAITHAIIWTIVPLFIRQSFTNDTIEAITWGQQFLWGYDKNPWLAGFIAHLGIQLGGANGVGIYFLQSLFILLGSWSVWRLTATFSNPVYAIIAAFVLEACACYTVDVQGFNDNFILMGLLPFASLLFWHAIKSDKLIYWLSGASVLALATMAKYDATLLGICIALYLLVHPQRIHYLTSLKTYAALLLFILIISPNFLWLWQHDFLTINYAFQERGGLTERSWLDKMIYNLIFIRSLSMNYLPSLIVLLVAFAARTKASIVQSGPLNTQERQFLFWIALGPILVLLFLGFGMGLTLHREWGTTFMSFWATYFLIIFKPNISSSSLRRFLILIVTLLFLWPIGYLFLSIKNDTGNFPAQAISNLASQIWRENFNSPLPYVAGNRFSAGHVAFYSPDKPAVLMEWNAKISPWINLRDLKCKGALFIQDSNYSGKQFANFPQSVRKEFPSLKILPPISVPLYRNRLQKQPINVLIGLLPPNKNACNPTSASG